MSNLLGHSSATLPKPSEETVDSPSQHTAAVASSLNVSVTYDFQWLESIIYIFIMQKKNEREEKKLLNTFLESVVTLREGKYCGQVIKKQTIPPSSQKNKTELAY